MSKNLTAIDLNGDWTTLTTDPMGQLCVDGSGIGFDVAMRVIIVGKDDPDFGSVTALKISPDSTVSFRGEQRPITEILKYIEELETALAEAHLMDIESPVKPSMGPVV